MKSLVYSHPNPVNGVQLFGSELKTAVTQSSTHQTFRTCSAVGNKTCWVSRRSLQRTFWARYEISDPGAEEKQRKYGATSEMRAVTLSGSRDRSVGIAIRLRAGRSEFETILFATVFRSAVRPTQAPAQWLPGVFFLGVNRPVRKADHTPLFAVKVKNLWSYTSTHPYAFMTSCLVKRRNTSSWRDA
jgi:hypothetical protein